MFNLDTRQNSCYYECKMESGWKMVFQCAVIFTYLMKYSSVFHLNVNYIGTISNGYNFNYSLNGNTIDIGIIKRLQFITGHIITII